MLDTILIILIIVALGVALVNNIILLISGLRKAKTEDKKKR